MPPARRPPHAARRRPGSRVPGQARHRRPDGVSCRGRRAVDWRRRRVGVEAATSVWSTSCRTSSATAGAGARPYVNMRFSGRSSCRRDGSRCRSVAMPLHAAPTSISSTAPAGPQLSPGRDLGVMAHGRLSDAFLTTPATFCTTATRSVARDPRRTPGGAGRVGCSRSWPQEQRARGWRWASRW